MTGRNGIAALLPHAGAMVLLDGIEDWDAASIHCRAGTHLDPANPLRRNGRLAAIAAVEYGLQAAAVHGTLTGGAPTMGYLAGLREVVLEAERLDDASLGRLRVMARLEYREEHGAVYGFAISAEDGRLLASGSGVIALRDSA